MQVRSLSPFRLWLICQRPALALENKIKLSRGGYLNPVTRSQSRSHDRSHKCTLPNTTSTTYPHTHTHVHTHTHTLTHSHTHPLTHSHTHPLTHSHTQTCTHAHTHTLTHSYTHTRTHAHPYTPTHIEISFYGSPWRLYHSSKAPRAVDMRQTQELFFSGKISKDKESKLHLRLAHKRLWSDRKSS